MFKRLLKEIYGQVIDNNNDWPRFNLLKNEFEFQFYYILNMF